ncbi:hypothetical protein RJ55_02636 [Drechmeria coniospora]|nr:hypothetical protein RJ55_02636 [Drechmeria coniospora]
MAYSPPPLRRREHASRRGQDLYDDAYLAAASRAPRRDRSERHPPRGRPERQPLREPPPREPPPRDRSERHPREHPPREPPHGPSRAHRDQQHAVWERPPDRIGGRSQAHDRRRRHDAPPRDTSPDAPARRRHASPDPRPRGREAHRREAHRSAYGSDDGRRPSAYGGHDGRRSSAYGSDDGRRLRRADSHGKAGARGGPSPQRGRRPGPLHAATAATAARDPKFAAPRRSSMPATVVKKGASWLANPLVQAGARTAFAAGAQAVMRSRNDPSPWLGAKGAKVATAALGAALVDGLVNQKHPAGAKQDLVRSGVAALLGELGAKDDGRRHGHGHGPSRRRKD